MVTFDSPNSVVENQEKTRRFAMLKRLVVAVVISVLQPHAKRRSFGFVLHARTVVLHARGRRIACSNFVLHPQIPFCMLKLASGLGGWG